MTIRLSALPLKGESFLFSRNDKIVLIDGSYKGKQLSKNIVKEHPYVNKIDIVICTHADADHAGGLRSIIDDMRTHHPNFKVGQFWLPGRWVHALETLMPNPKIVVGKLIDELDNIVREDLGDDIEAILDQHACAPWQRDPHLDPGNIETTFAPANFEQDVELGQDEPSADEPAWLTEARHAIEHLDERKAVAKAAFETAKKRIRRRRASEKIGEKLAAYWLGLIETAASIRAIAEQAIKYNVRIRWFDFDKFSTSRRAVGGVPGFLVPVNSVEETPPPRVGLTYLAMLSPVNEACLAFLAPPGGHLHGILFTGDSPLGDGRGYATSFLPAPGANPLLNTSRLIATAPHHGAETNAIAYGHIQRFSTVDLWVRAGGTSKHPGATFRALPSCERICTHCPLARALTFRATPARIDIIYDHRFHPVPVMMLAGKWPCNC